MKLILKLLFVFISIATMLLILALFVEKKIVIKEVLIVDKPVEDVFRYVKLIDRQDAYLDWPSNASSQPSTQSYSDGNVGYTSPIEFDLKTQGRGRFRLTEIIPNKHIKCSFVPTTNTSAQIELTITTESKNDTTTTVGIVLSTSESYPYNLRLLFSKMPLTESTHLQKSVKNLKVNLESQE